MSALDDLELRAGASDEDRDAWLAERAQGITATEVRDLAKASGSEAAMQRILDEKRTPRSFDNKWVAWGRKREAEFLAPWAERQFGIRPEHRVFHSVEDPRFLASPDGIGLIDGEIVLAEDKTSKHDLSRWDVLQDLGYADQVQWQMFVTSAVKTALIGEQHDDRWLDHGGEFPEPTPRYLDPSVTWILRDEQRIAQLKQFALDWLTWAQEKREATDPTPFVDLVDRVRRARAAAAPFQDEVKQAEEALRGALTEGNVHRLETSLWKVSFPEASVRHTFDSKAFKAEHPDIYKQFTKETTAKPRLTITEKEKTA